MKVSSPIGDLPFQPRRLSLHGATVQVEGVMGAWPARVEMSAADLPALARLVAKPTLIALATVTLTALAQRHHRRRRH